MQMTTTKEKFRWLATKWYVFAYFDDDKKYVCYQQQKPWEVGWNVCKIKYKNIKNAKRYFCNGYTDVID